MRASLLAAAGGLLVTLLASPSAADAGDPSRLLERYRPVLRYDEAETHFAQEVSLPPQNAEVRRTNRAYGQVAEERGETWLQYWLFYAYNPQDRSPLKTGRHEGDWELIQLRLGADGKPDLSTTSQHSWAETCEWSELELTDVNGSRVPVLYVANGSHATYAEAGSYDRPFPDPTDEADGDGRQIRPPLTELRDSKPAWVEYSGRWGETESGIVPGESPSPRGPKFQDGGAWDEPRSFAREVGRACHAGAPSRPWQTAATIGVLALIVVGLVILALRRRRPVGAVG